MSPRVAPVSVTIGVLAERWIQTKLGFPSRGDTWRQDITLIGLNHCQCSVSCTIIASSHQL